MSAYRTFIRTWYRRNPAWPNGLEPHAGRKTHSMYHATEESAHKECREYNTTHPAGRLSRKMEYEEV